MYQTKTQWTNVKKAWDLWNNFVFFFLFWKFCEILLFFILFEFELCAPDFDVKFMRKTRFIFNLSGKKNERRVPIPLQENLKTKKKTRKPKCEWIEIFVRRIIWIWTGYNRKQSDRYLNYFSDNINETGRFFASFWLHHWIVWSWRNVYERFDFKLGILLIFTFEKKREIFQFFSAVVQFIQFF